MISFLQRTRKLILGSGFLILGGCFLNTTNSQSGDEFIAQGIPHLSVLAENNCFQCHQEWKNYTEDSQWREALSAEILPGDASNSDFYKRVIGASGVPVMPPDGSVMPSDDAAIIQNWINMMALE